MTSPQVGSAYVVLRALTAQMKRDIREAVEDAFRESEARSHTAGKAAGRRYAEGFREGLNGSGLEEELGEVMRDMERRASESGDRAGNEYGARFRRQMTENVQQAAREAAATEQRAANEADSAQRRRSARNRAQNASSGSSSSSSSRAGSSSSSSSSSDSGRTYNRDSRGRFASSGDSGDSSNAVRRTVSAISGAIPSFTTILGLLKAMSIASALALAPLVSTALTGQLIAIIGSLSQMAGVLATLPALAVAAGAAFATIKIATSGVSDAFSAIKASNENAAESAYQYAQSVSAAEDAVVSAQQSVQSATRGVSEALYNETQAQKAAQRAQEDLTDARKDAVYQLQDMNLQLKGAALSEEDANLAILRARQRLQETMSDGKSSALDKKEADLSYRQALQRLDEVKLRNAELRDEVQEANQKGVEGSDQVVAAKEGVESANKAVADSQYAVVQSQQALTNAIKSAAKAQENLNHTLEQGNPALKAVNDAMAKLAPNAQDFVRQVTSLSGAWTDVRKEIQNNFFAGLGKEIVDLANVQLPVLKKGLGDIATELNEMAKSLLDAFNTPEAAKEFETVLGNIRQMFENMRPGMTAFAEAFKELVNVGSTFLPRLGQAFTDLGERWKKSAQEAAADGSLAKFIEDGITSMKLFGGIVANVGGILNSVFGGAATAYGDTLLQKFDNLTERANKFLKSTEGQEGLVDFFTIVRQSAETLDPVMDAFVDDLKILGPILMEISREAAPGVTALLEGLGRGLKALEPVSGDIGRILADIDRVLGSLLEQFGRVGAVIIDSVEPVFKALSDALVDLLPLFGDIAESVGPDVKKIFQELAELIPPLKDAVKSLVEELKPYLEVLIKIAAEALPPVVDWLKALLKAIDDLAPVIILAAAVYAGWKTALAAVAAYQAVVAAIGFIQGAFATAQIAIYLATTAVWGWITATASAASTAIVGALTTISGAFTTARIAIYLAAGATWSWVTAQASAAGAAIVSALGAITSAYNTARVAIFLAATSTWGWVTAQASAAAASIAAGISNIVTAFNTARTAIVLAAAATWGWVTAQASAAAASIAAGISNVATAFNTARTAIMLATIAAWNWVRVQMVSALAATRAAVVSLAASLMQYSIVQRTVTLLTTVWTGVQAAFNAVMALNPIALVVIAIAALVAAIVIAYRNSETFRDIVDDTWRVIRESALWTWENVLKPAFTWIADFTMNVLVPAILWLWHNAIEPAFNAIGTVISFWWNNIAKPIFGFLVDTLQFVGRIIEWWWKNIVVPAFNAVGDVISWWWNNIVQPAWDAFTAAIRFVADLVSWWWHEIVEPAFRAVGNVISWVIDNVIVPAIDIFHDAIEGIGNFFRETVNGIENVWNRIREITRAPIAFFVNTIYNDGLARAWNAVAGVIGLDNLKLPRIEGFSSGGVIPGYSPGKDDRFIAVGGGEGILRPEAVRAMTPQMVNEINQRARSGGVESVRNFLGYFAEGGIVGNLKSIVQEKFPGMQLTSGLRYTDNGWHSKGHAGDFSNGGDAGTPEMKGLAAYIADNFVSRTYELIHSPFNRNIKNMSFVGDGMSFYGAGTMAGHRNHVHWAVDRALTPDDAKPGEGGGFFSGIGDAISSVVDWARDRVADLFEKPVRAIGDKIPDFGNSPLGQMPRKLYENISQKAIDFVRGKADEQDTANGRSADAGNTPWDFSAGVEQWDGAIRAALAREGWEVNERNVALTKAQIQTESGGNPNIIQSVQDVNSGGNEAVGLLQVIPGTFAAYRNPSLPNDRTNPDANISAALRYYRNRWGNDLGTMWGQGHGYDQGGVIKPGQTNVFNGLSKPEALLNPDQWQAVIRAIGLAIGIAKLPRFNSISDAMQAPTAQLPVPAGTAPELGSPSYGPQDDKSLNAGDQAIIDNAPVEIPYSSPQEAEQNTGTTATDTWQTKVGSWARDAGVEILGEFLAPVGLDKWSEKIVDGGTQALQNANAIGGYANEATGMGFAPNKIADTLIFNGMDPVKAMEELRRELSSGQYLTRYRG